MLTPLQLPGIIPAGAGVELVDDDDSILMRCPRVLEGRADQGWKLSARVGHKGGNGPETVILKRFPGLDRRMGIPPAGNLPVAPPDNRF